jgi:Ca2+-binding RTX toxin-like protein
MPTIDGTSGNDTLIGTADADIINGLEGDDLLEGGAGDDTLDGGEGNDTASYASSSSWVGVHLSSASPQDTVGAGIDTLISIENLVGSAFSDILSGNDGANRLEGGAGFDVLIGGLGNDLLDGGEGEDEAHYQHAPSAVNVNLAISGAQNTSGAGIDTLVSIERVRGSEFNDVLRGNASDNGLVGQGGDDWLFGGAGNDALNGTDGYDRMYGGTGNDIYYVLDNTDFTYELADEGQDFVLAWVDHQLRDNVEDLQLMMNGTGVIGKGNGLDNGITGNDGANKLYGFDGNDGLGGNGGDDWLFGGAGNDILHGGAGYDRMYGGSGDDIYQVTDATDYAYENVGEGTDKVITTINHSLRANIENLQLDGSSDLRGYGNSLNNVIDGNYGSNLLYGRDGNDDLRGFDGNDILYGENGNDLLQGGTGQDRFYGGSGSDTFLFRSGDFAGQASGTADRIHDFSQAEGDKINLNEVDFNSLVDGFQGHIFIGNAAFGGTAGEMRYEQVSGQTYIRIDTDGDASADLSIRLDGVHSLQASDFMI